MRQSARIITIVWGESHLDDLLSVTLPALIAPGNLPALVQSFDCEFVLVTETKLFERVRNAPVFRQIESKCKARLVSLDDLVMTRLHYGMTLTYAYMRGFEDLGERVTDWYLIFLNADFVLADGSYRSLAQRMISGERLVVAPSYCVVEEQVKPLLRYVLADPHTHALAIPPRQMAALAIPNRHYTIRGKTVNQQIYSMDRIEQFYWYVDEHTLLAHQFPIAVVCMKPERAIRSLETFWDYGLVSEFCPTVKPCVLHDSDDFLMIELRSADTYAEYLSLGWPSVDEIAADLSSFTTKDHRDYGRHTLILHSEDIPAAVTHAKASLRSFVDSVYQRMPLEPRDYQKHPYWIASVPDFHRAKALYQTSKAEKDSCEDSFQHLRRGGEASVPSVSPGLLWKELASVKEALVGRWPRLSRHHLYWDDVRHARQVLETVLQEKDRKVLLISSHAEGRLLCHFMEKIAGTYARVEEFYAINDLMDRAIGRESDFDICVIEVNFDTLRYFPRMFKAIRPRMRKSGKVVALYLNAHDRPIYKKNLTMLKTYFHSTDSSRIFFSGSMLGVRARRLFRLSLALRAQGGLLRFMVGAFLMPVSLALACAANICRRSGPPQRFTEHLSSITIEIDIA